MCRQHSQTSRKCRLAQAGKASIPHQSNPMRKSRPVPLSKASIPRRSVNKEGRTQRTNPGANSVNPRCTVKLGMYSMLKCHSRIPPKQRGPPDPRIGVTVPLQRQTQARPTVDSAVVAAISVVARVVGSAVAYIRFFQLAATKLAAE